MAGTIWSEVCKSYTRFARVSLKASLMNTQLAWILITKYSHNVCSRIHSALERRAPGDRCLHTR
jgi:hypothetical protein